MLFLILVLTLILVLILFLVLILILVLISRRPPQQKFSSFEEYMAAHGGATAPIEDHSEDYE